MTVLPDAWLDFMDMKDMEEEIRPIIERVFIDGMKYALSLPLEEQRRLREAG